MFDTTALQNFTVSLRSSIGNLDDTEMLCESVKRSANALIKVLSTSILHVCKEVQAYLAYYIEEVEKGMDCASVTDEQARLLNHVFTPFENKLAASSQVRSDGEQLAIHLVQAVAELVNSWDSFPKEDLGQILASERNTNKS